MQDNDFLSDIELKKKIAYHLETGTFLVTKHAAEEQMKDDLDLLDTLRILRLGAPDSKYREFHTKSQSWRYGIKGKTEDRRMAIVIVTFNLETAVRDGKVMQDFESELLTTGGTHSQMVKGPPVVNDSGSKDCVNLPSPTAVSRFKGTMIIITVFKVEKHT